MITFSLMFQLSLFIEKNILGGVSFLGFHFYILRSTTGLGNRGIKMYNVYSTYSKGL